MRVQIVKTNKRSYWYHKYIGQIFNVEDDPYYPGHYMLRRRDEERGDDELRIHWIDHDDCIPMENLIGGINLEFKFIK